MSLLFALLVIIHSIKLCPALKCAGELCIDARKECAPGCDCTQPPGDEHMFAKTTCYAAKGCPTVQQCQHTVSVRWIDIGLSRDSIKSPVKSVANYKTLGKTYGDALKQVINDEIPHGNNPELIKRMKESYKGIAVVLGGHLQGALNDRKIWDKQITATGKTLTLITLSDAPIKDLKDISDKIIAKFTYTEGKASAVKTLLGVSAHLQRSNYMDYDGFEEGYKKGRSDGIAESQNLYVVSPPNHSNSMYLLVLFVMLILIATVCCVMFGGIGIITGVYCVLFQRQNSSRSRKVHLENNEI